MEQLFRIFIFQEMLLVNLILTHRCCSKKYSISKVIIELTFYTILVFFVSLLIRLRINSYISEGNIILIGFTYYFPLKRLYNETADRILSIMFLSWIHSITVTFISIQIALLINTENYWGVALVIQTIIYSFSTRILIKFVKDKFLYILKNISSDLNKYFILLSFGQFTTIVIIQMYFHKEGYSYWGIISISLNVLTATISYRLIYILVRSYKNTNFLTKIAYSDSLTTINNRLALYIDCEQLILERKPFTLIYMDLDDFKKINDLYGHLVGDNYLKQFTKASINAIGDYGSLYRMSGDEFVCIYHRIKLIFS